MVTILIQNDFVAEYLRVSTGNQDLQMQIDANEVYLKNYDKEKVLEFKDYDVSATKLKIDERPALKRLLKAVEEGKISKIIVYDRDRFARDVYEYVYIAKKLYKHNVEVNFTAADATPFSKDITQETWYGLFAQMEGRKIQTRLYDVRNRYPQQLIGYKKVEIEKKRYYKANEAVGTMIFQLFQDVSSVNSLETLVDIIIHYSKLLKRKPNRIIGILNTPFFSAHGRTLDGNYFNLDHVEPIIKLSLFTNVQNALKKYGKSYDDVVAKTIRESVLNPSCGICGEQMKFRKGKLGTFGMYVCQKHKKIRISTDDLDLLLKQTVQESIKKIDIQKLKRVCQNSINKHSKLLKHEQENSAEKVEELCVNICTNFTPYSDTSLINKPMKEVKLKKEKMFKLEEKIYKFDLLTSEISKVVKYVKYQLENSLSEDEFLELVELLVGNVEIHAEYTKINVYFEEFFDEGGE